MILKIIFLITLCVVQINPLENRGVLGTFAAEKIIERIQRKLRYGFPLIKIPPLAPLKLGDRNNTINLSFLRFNSSLSNILIDGIDNFRINYVEFSWRNKSMNFSLTFNNLRSNGSYFGAGNFINYIPLRGKGNYNFDVYDLTTNVATTVSIKRFRMQIVNFTTVSTMNRLKSNVTGLNSKNRWTTRSISKISNRLIELATPRIFDLNQKLLNYAINKIIVPRINAILTMFSVIVPSTTTPPSTTNDVKSKKKKKKKPISHDSTQQKLRKDDTVYFRELDDNTIIKYLRENPIQLPDDDDKVISMLFNEKYYDSKRKIIFQ